MKTKLAFFISFLVCVNFAQAQTETFVSETDSTESIDFAIVEGKPEFKGGDEALLNFIASNCVYPEEALKQKIEGKVFVKFVIDKKGRVTKAKVIRSVHPLLDEEALRVVRLLPDWTPGTQRGKKVAVSFVIPVNFKLSR